jgi:hypothetical protein
MTMSHLRQLAVAALSGQRQRGHRLHDQQHRPWHQQGHAQLPAPAAGQYAEVGSCPGWLRNLAAAARLPR